MTNNVNLKAFILEALSDAIQIALAEAKAAERKAAYAASTASERIPLPWWEISESIAREIAK